MGAGPGHVVVEHLHIFLTGQLARESDVRAHRAAVLLEQQLLHLGVFGGLGLLFFLLGDIQAQHAMLQLCADVRLRKGIAHIEASLTLAGITFLTNVFCIFLFALLVKSFGCLNSQITIFKRNLNLVLRKSRQIHFHNVTVIGFLNICFHKVLTPMTVEFLFKLIHFIIIIKRKIKKVIEQIFTKYTRHQHKSSLLS